MPLHDASHDHPVATALTAVTVAEGAGLIGVPFTGSAREWYAELRKPSFAPPPEVFGPVWTALYAMIGVAGWLVLRSPPSPQRKRALVLFGAQLALNAAWTPIFFGTRRKTLALVEIVVLWVALVATVRAFWRVRPLAAVLLLPYLAWVTFAAVLNGALVRLN